MSLFVAYFGSTRQYPELAHHTILLGDRYRELLRDIFDRRILADDFSLYLHAPTRTDPGLAPPGHEAFYVLSPVPNNRSGVDWRQAAEPYFEKILGALDERLLPGIRENIVSTSWMTPADFEDELRSPEGSAFGPEPTLRQSAYFRYHNRSPDVEGLFFVGAGTHPGAGVPGVLSSARVLERVVPRPATPVALPLPSRAIRAGHRLG
jgi:phytoene desaturase